MVALGFLDSPGDFGLSGFDPNTLDGVSLAKPLSMDHCCCCCCATGEIRRLKRCLWQYEKDIEETRSNVTYSALAWGKWKKLSLKNRQRNPTRHKTSSLWKLVSISLFHETRNKNLALPCLLCRWNSWSLMPLESSSALSNLLVSISSHVNLPPQDMLLAPPGHHEHSTNSPEETSSATQVESVARAHLEL